MPASGDGELTTSRGSSSHLGPQLLLLKSGPDVWPLVSSPAS